MELACRPSRAHLLYGMPKVNWDLMNRNGNNAPRADKILACAGSQTTVPYYIQCADLLLASPVCVVVVYAVKQPGNALRERERPQEGQCALVGPHAPHGVH